MGTGWRSKVVRWAGAQYRVLQVWEALRLRGGWGAGLNRPVWVHVASVGEYEQGLPVIEALRDRGFPVVVTFFSPSGEQIVADAGRRGLVAWYLPFGGRGVIGRWLDMVSPCMALFIRYEHWLPYLRALRYRGIPVLNVAAYFGGGMSWVKRWWYRLVLSYYTRVLVQDLESARVAREILGVPSDKVVVVGDPRVDRVLALRREGAPRALEERLRVWTAGSYRLIIVGSSYSPEERMLVQVIRHFRGRAEFRDLRWVVVPHVVEASRLAWWEGTGLRVVRYSRLAKDPSLLADREVLLVDGYGLLKYLYRYGYLAVVGGGFARQVHSILEPVVWRVPVLTGPRLGSSREARVLEGRALWTFRTAQELQAHLTRLLTVEEEYRRAQEAIDAFLVRECGAVSRILDQLTPWLGTL